jgi:hypothetical protein
MKKSILSLFLLFSVFNLSAQKQTTYSVKLGSTYSGMYGSDIDNISNVPTTVGFINSPGIVVGGAINFIEPIFEKHPPVIHSYSGSKVEILYFENGANIESDAYDVASGANLGFPIIQNIKQSNIRLTGQSYFRLSPTFYIGGGLYTSFLLSKNENVTSDIPTGFVFIPSTLNDYAKNRFDLGTMISFKYMLTDNLSWEARASTGFLPWNHIEEVPGVSDAYWTKAYNISLSASCSYYFGKLRYKDSWR